MSRWASARPRSASETTFTASLMNFFMAPSFSEASVDQLGHPLDEIRTRASSARCFPGVRSTGISSDKTFRRDTAPFSPETPSAARAGWANR